MKTSNFLCLFVTILTFISCRFNKSDKDMIIKNEENVDSVSVDLDLSLEEGKKLYLENCRPCHDIDFKVVGPLLNEIDTINRQWLYKWLISNQALINNEDKRAISIFKNYNMILHPDFKLSEKEIDNIVKYIRGNRIINLPTNPQTK